MWSDERRQGHLGVALNLKPGQGHLNLIIFKMGLYNSASANEQDILEILNPLINSENIWQSHALYILAEYFFAKNEETKSKEFFEKIIELKNSNPQIKLEAQKRLQRDFSE